MTWQFIPQPKSSVDYGITQRDDFSNENVGLEETIVRESVQNSLDAHSGGDKPVKVTFRWYAEGDGLDKNYLKALLEEQIPHAEVSGIDTRSVLEGEARVLSIEDFNTTVFLARQRLKMRVISQVSGVITGDLASRGISVGAGALES